jgi:hypothetical protein
MSSRYWELLWKRARRFMIRAEKGCYEEAPPTGGYNGG